MECLLNNTYICIQNSGLAPIAGQVIHGSQLMHNLPNSPWQYSKRQTKGEEIEKCLDGGLEPTYNFSIFSLDNFYVKTFLTVLHWHVLVKKMAKTCKSA